MSLITAGNAVSQLGPLFIGAVANAILFSFEIAAFLYFFLGQRTEPVLVKAILVGLFAVDLVAVIACLVGVFMMLVSSWGSPEALNGVNWLLSTYVVTIAFGTYLSQLYMIQRIHKFTRSVPTCILLSVGSLVAMCGALSASAVTWTSLASHTMQIRISIWIGAAAGTDILITCILVAVLYKARKEVTAFNGSHLRKPLASLMIRTVQTGALTCAVCLAGLGVYLHDPAHATSAIGWAFPLGRIYTFVVYFCIFSAAYTRDQQPDPALEMPSWVDATTLDPNRPSIGRSTTNAKVPQLGLAQVEREKKVSPHGLARIYTLGFEAGVESEEKGGFGLSSALEMD